MKRLFIISGALFLVVVATAMAHLANKKNVPKQPMDKDGFAVVELFTSEGCSSCPPADEALASLLKEYKTNVYVLGFHVDYWNSLGWKDVYSSGEYSKRQQQYGSLFKLSSIYTPQAIVNGQTEFTGSDTRKLHDAVEKGLQQSHTSSIEISAKSADDKTVNVTYRLAAPSSNLINVALVQSTAQSNVQRGENSGRLLHHVNVVRDFKTIKPKEAKGEITLTLPAGLTAKDCTIMAYVQDAQSWKAVGATASAIK